VRIQDVLPPSLVSEEGLPVKMCTGNSNLIGDGAASQYLLQPQFYIIFFN